MIFWKSFYMQMYSLSSDLKQYVLDKISPPFCLSSHMTFVQPNLDQSNVPKELLYSYADLNQFEAKDIVLITTMD